MNTRLFPVLIAAVVLPACVVAPPPRPAAPPQRPVDLTKVYFYPTQGQTQEQQDRDRYDCHVWAVKQTSFDPTQRDAPRATQTKVTPAQTPGEKVGTAAILGAVLGAVIAGPGNVGKGAVVGAMAGTVAGSAAAANEQAEADAVNAAPAREQVRGGVRYEREAADYRRAMSACLTGRGYSVR